MKTKIITIGNSQGIRIPKAIIEQCGFDNSVEMEVIDGNLVLTPIKNIREGWEESFKEMAANGDDELLIDDAISTLEDEDWKW
ncbi:MAG: AbrB/MazE/SpoVT family DNA-binding domain-containing protein [Xenococcaceae cyanobacterium MO_167.B52]|nr:AbrB/MazE/SpoVT family DNA-binding domain-containing protein [Xenococcaceae cyanobacterium MO_167.B52]